ncbi:hypothetical protein CROQUDRAFT_102579 [Cronartium quercuum f. sp. fusiforme G11]|uniref:Uncharacterized protein n=1 Tax=Cronartium quercuum f. sp. fusiforme G11 TaxID=708437 RepID=A0A9P6N588_9BASI|nr:hypothetical protein CROQUDRAFT_102579 [Cronartium quercuum f. sp. fusiforme G11]
MHNEMVKIVRLEKAKAPWEPSDHFCVSTKCHFMFLIMGNDLESYSQVKGQLKQVITNSLECQAHQHLQMWMQSQSKEYILAYFTPNWGGKDAGKSNWLLISFEKEILKYVHSGFCGAVSHIFFV